MTRYPCLITAEVQLDNNVPVFELNFCNIVNIRDLAVIISTVWKYFDLTIMLVPHCLFSVSQAPWRQLLSTCVLARMSSNLGSFVNYSTEHGN